MNDTTDCAQRAGVPAAAAVELDTPAFVFDAGVIHTSLQQLAQLSSRSGLKLLFSVKACALQAVLEIVAKRVDGFSVSSWFESRIARRVLADKGTVHLSSPGLDGRELADLVRECDAIHFNSLHQWQRLRPLLPAAAGAGVRVNPLRSYVADDRYNPCRPHSKLGIPLNELRAALGQGAVDLRRLDGLHFHSHCESGSYRPLVETLAHLEAALPDVFARIRWLNMGGGYMAEAGEADALVAKVVELKQRHGFEVYMEPGKAVLGQAGSLAACVIDLFDSSGKTVAVLDTSVNHQPEVFEYGRVPPVAEADDSGRHRYLLAGGTCLAGDLFGEYAFAEPLAIGSRITFLNVGAYSLTRSHRFNGHNLPAIYLRKPDGALQLLKQYDYEDFRRQWSGT